MPLTFQHTHIWLLMRLGLGSSVIASVAVRLGSVFSNRLTLRLPPVRVTLTKRRVYWMRFLARPFGVFFFSCGSTCTWCGQRYALILAGVLHLPHPSYPSFRAGWCCKSRICRWRLSKHSSPPSHHRSVASLPASSTDVDVDDGRTFGV